METTLNLITLLILIISSAVAYFKGASDIKVKNLKSSLDILSKYDKISNKKVDTSEVYKEEKW